MAVPGMSAAGNTRINTITEHTQAQPVISADNNIVAAAWQSDAHYALEIVVSVSKDGGDSFSGDISVAGGAFEEIHREPAITVSGSNIYVAWQAMVDDRDYDIFFAASRDEGKTFSKPRRVNSHKDGNQLFPAVTAEGDNVFIAWHDNRESPSSFQIFMARSEDGGETFDKEKQIAPDSGSTFNLWPFLCSIDRTLASTWQGTIGGEFDIFAAVSMDMGESFTRVESPPGRDGVDRQFARAACGSTGLHVVWVEERDINRPPGDTMFRYPTNDHDVYYSFMKDYREFSEPVKVDEISDGHQLRPWVTTIDDNRAAVAWFDGRSVADYDIYFSAGSMKTGFELQDRINLSHDSDSRNPSVAVSGDRIFVVWQDDSDGDYDIYMETIQLDSLD